jgi:hypothetical protein
MLFPRKVWTDHVINGRMMMIKISSLNYIVEILNHNGEEIFQHSCFNVFDFKTKTSFHRNSNCPYSWLLLAVIYIVYVGHTDPRIKDDNWKSWWDGKLQVFKVVALHTTLKMTLSYTYRVSLQNWQCWFLHLHDYAVQTL